MRRGTVRSLLYLTLILMAVGFPAAIHAQVDPFAEIQRLFELGDRALGAGDNATAEWAFAAALQGAQAVGDAKNLGATLNNIGLAYYNHHQPQRAVDFLGRALQVKQAIGDPRNTVSALLNLGNAYLDLGRLDQAETWFQQTLQLGAAIGDPKATGGALNNLGLIYQSQDRPEKALDYYTKALSVVNERANPHDAGNTLLNMAHILFRLHRPDEAIKAFVHVVALSEASGDFERAGTTLDTVGQYYGRKSQWDTAAQYHAQAVTDMQRAGKPRELAAALNNLGIDCMRGGQKEKAVAALSRAVEMKRALGNRQDLSSSLSNLALLYFDLGDMDKAGAAFAATLENDEALADTIADPAQLGQFQEQIGPNLYNRYAAVLIRQNKPETALEILERGRGQGLAKQAAQNRSDYRRWLGPAEASTMQGAVKAFQQAAAAWRSAQESDLLGDAEDDSGVLHKVIAIRQQYEESRAKLILTRRELAARSPAFNWMLGAHHPSAADLKGLAAREPDTLFIAWGIGQEATSTLHVLSQKDGIKGYVLKVGEKEVRDRVNAWREAVTDPESDPKTEAENSRKLYDMLFGELEKAGLMAPGAFTHLMLAGDGPLLDVPFAALENAAGTRLVERYSLSTAVSFGMLLWPREDAKAHGTLFCAADPLGDEKGGGALPAARAEGQAVAGLFPGSALLIGGAATKAEVEKRMPDYALLHFATHGYLDEGQGLASGLVVARPKGSADDTKLLTADEIAGMHLSAQLSVLSACETAQGQKSGGEGLLGLSWAFRAAGCPSVVASQWSVDDAATGRLMVEFYNRLKAGNRKDDSLRAAMLKLAGAPATTRPYFWSAFEVFGDPDPVHIGTP